MELWRENSEVTVVSVFYFYGLARPAQLFEVDVGVSAGAVQLVELVFGLDGSGVHVVHSFRGSKCLNFNQIYYLPIVNRE